MHLKRAILGLSTVTAAAAMAAACSSSSSPATPGNDAGEQASSGSASGSGSGSSSGSPVGDGGASTLYERLGGHAGIRAAVDAIVAQELMNADIASYFFFQGGAPANGHPTADQIEECFTDLVGNAAGGPEAYPTTVTTDAGAFTCRSMAAIHGPLLISGGTFDTFVMIAGAELTALKVAPADITTLAGALEATKAAIVAQPLADAGLEPFPGDAGTAPTTTLYQRLGGHSGIRSAVNAIVGQELMNADIASYFFFQGGAPANGHPTADQIEECFTDLVANAAGGTETYPTTVTTDAGSFACRPMAAIHQPLQISGGTFDTFVMIAGGELQTLGVAPADISTLAGALEGTKSAIVKSSIADAGLQPYPGDGG